MKNIISLMLAAVLVFSCVTAVGEVFDFSQIAGLPFEYASGVGAWSCEILFDADGNFTGNFHDSDMGDTGEGYNNGTVYVSEFHGVLSLSGAGDAANTWILLINSLSSDIDAAAGTVSIQDGVRYIICDPAEIMNGTQFVLYTPGASLDIIDEDMSFWFHLNDFEFLDGDTLPVYGLYNLQNQYGFVANPLR